MKAIVYHGKQDVRVEDVPDAGLGSETDALIRIERTAICGSDLHLWHADAAMPGVAPFTVGHEFMGVVEDVGSGVQRIRKGDRVLACCTIGCGQCANCRRGNYSGCSVTTEGGQSNVFGFGRYNGGQAEAAAVPFADTNCVVLPSDLDAEACLFLTDILPTGYMGSEFAEVGPGDTVVVFGCGPVGTFAQRSAEVRGAANIIAVDLDDGRLARAAERGYLTVNPSRQDLLAEVLEHTDGIGADAVIEAIGVPDLIAQAATVARPGGRIAVIGVIMAPVELPWPLLFSKNLRVSTGLVNPQVFIPKLLPLIRTGRLDPAEIISHRLPLAEGSRGYEIFANHEENALKVVLQP